MLILHVLQSGRALALRHLHFFARLDLNGHQGARDFELYQFQQAAEQLESLAFIFLFGIFLRVTAKVNALAQVIQRRQMFAPMHIQGGKQHQTLIVSRSFRGRHLPLYAIGRVGCVNRAREQPLFIQVGFGLKPLAQQYLKAQIG